MIQLPDDYPTQPGQALQGDHNLDSLQNSTLEDLANLAAEICNAPIALISLLKSNHCWLNTPAPLVSPNLNQEGSFYWQTIQQTTPLIVLDSSHSTATDNEPLQQNFAEMRFYAGFPLIDRSGVTLGALCIIDYQPRILTDQQQTCLNLLSRQIIAQLELRHRLAERAKTAQTVLATMSHEIRTPMNAVLGMANLLSETGLDTEQQEFVETIRIGSNSLLTLINDILDFSRLEAGKVKIENVEFDLSLCIEEVVDLMATTAYGKGLELAMLIAENVPNFLKGDVHRLRQVLINLVANAIKFTSYGEIIIQVELQTEDDLTATIHFAVRDTGIGIPQALHEEIFQPFAQLETPLTRTYGGSGLGLAICKDLVQLMGGTIGLNSTEGIGTCFWFTLTFHKAISHNNPSELSGQTSHLVNARLRNTKILLVETKTITYQVLQAYLANFGIQIDQVGSIVSALKTLKTSHQNKDPYTLIMIDGQVTDAKLFASQVNADPTLASTASIIMTSLSQRDISKHYRQLGFTNYLVKPLKKNRVLNCLQTTLKEVHDTTTNATNISSRLLQQRPFSYQVTAPAQDRSVSSEIQPPSSTRSSQDLSHDRPSPSSQTLKILLVEDTPLNQKVVLKLLSRLGYQADLVENGQLALEAIEHKDYDLVFMDCQMPVMDGYATTQAIRVREGQARHTVVVAMTANAMVGDREKCLEVGMDDYLSKPIFKETLAAKLAYWHQKILDDRYATATPSIPDQQQDDPIYSEDRQALIDWHHLDQVSEGDRDFALELVQLFLQGNQPNLPLAKNAVAATDFKQLKQIAHQIKGSAINIGSIKIHAIAETIEQKAKSSQLEGISPLLEELTVLFQQVQTLWQQKSAE